MADLAGELAAALTAGPVPNTGPDLVRYAGGQAVLVQELTGLPRRPRRGDYTSQGDFEAERRRWTSAQRRVQRWAAPEGKQRRGLTKLAPLPPPVRRRLQRLANGRKTERLARDGARVRMLATVKVKSPGARSVDDVRTRWMPAPPGPGVYLEPATMREILDADRGDRAALFEAAFFEVYGMPDDAEIESVDELRIWPEGAPEPR